VRRVGVRDFGDVTYAGLTKMCFEGREEAGVGLGAGVRAVSAHAQPRFDERAEEPRPRGALMVSTVAGTHVAVVVRTIARLERRE
jgi:hypothetical protein